MGAKFNIRKGGYSRAVTGLSSGGVASFNAAWQMPEQFSRVISWIGSFTSIQRKRDPEVRDGGRDYPEKIITRAEAQHPNVAPKRRRRHGEQGLGKLAAG